MCWNILLFCFFQEKICYKSLDFLKIMHISIFLCMHFLYALIYKALQVFIFKYSNTNILDHPIFVTILLNTTCFLLLAYNWRYLFNLHVPKLPQTVEKYSFEAVFYATEKVLWLYIYIVQFGTYLPLLTMCYLCLISSHCGQCSVYGSIHTIFDIIQAIYSLYNSDQTACNRWYIRLCNVSYIGVWQYSIVIFIVIR